MLHKTREDAGRPRFCHPQNTVILAFFGQFCYVFLRCFRRFRTCVQSDEGCTTYYGLNAPFFQQCLATLAHFSEAWARLAE